MDMAQSFQVAPEYVYEITFMTKVSSIKYRVSNQIQVSINIVGIRYRTSTTSDAWTSYPETPARLRQSFKEALNQSTRPGCIGVNISERKSRTEQTKKRKKRELVSFPTASGATGTVVHGFCSSDDNPHPAYSLSCGPDLVANRQNSQNVTTLQTELALPSTGSWLTSRLSSTSPGAEQSAFF